MAAAIAGRSAASRSWPGTLSNQARADAYVVALGAKQGQSLVFKVQAWAPNVFVPKWTFLPIDQQGPQRALAVAVGPFGEVYAGGISEGTHPVFVVIGG